MSSRQEKGKLQISASALVELKATLFSKQREVRSKEKTRGADSTGLATNTVSEKTSAIWRKPPKQRRRGREGSGVAAAERKTRYSAEEEAELERSRKALEAKAALYDRLCGGEGVRGGGSDSEGEEEEGRYMVDFTRKIVEEKRAQQSNSSTKQDDRDPNEGKAEEEGEWTEYVDSFGRTRRCPKEDLPLMKAAEERMRERSATPDLMSEDMERERERRRWEEEQAQELDTPVGPVHYEGMRQGEVRTHGVGYYAFSTDEEKRSEQLNLLNKLRDQTLQQREKKLKVQEKRKAMMEARLAKVRERKRLKQPTVEEKKEEVSIQEGGEVEREEGEKRGTDLETGEERVEGGEADPIAAMIESELGRAREKAEKGGEGVETNKGKKKVPYVRPWDKGKVVDPIRKRKKELEEERLPEFAPPSSYGKIGAETKQVKLDHTDQNPYQNEDCSLPSSTSENHGLLDGQQDKTDGSTDPVRGPFHPPPTPPQNQYQYHTMQQTPYSGAYLYPTSVPFCNQYRGPPPLPPHFGPPPPPPHGPIPPYAGCLPPYQFPYFHPPPPPAGMPPLQPQSYNHQT